MTAPDHHHPAPIGVSVVYAAKLRRDQGGMARNASGCLWERADGKVRRRARLSSRRSRKLSNTGDHPAFLFSFSDAPVMKALSLYRDETRPS